MATTSCLLGSCLASTTSIDRTQRHSSFGISTSSLRPRVWRTSDTALSASARTGQLLTGAHGIPSVERYGATVSRPPCRLIGRCMPVHGDAPQYLQQFTRTADIPSRHRQTPVRSSVTDSLFVPAVRLSTVDRSAFPVPGARMWNDLPSDVTSSPPLFTFK